MRGKGLVRGKRKPRGCMGRGNRKARGGGGGGGGGVEERKGSRTENGFVKGETCSLQALSLARESLCMLHLLNLLIVYV